MAAQVTNYKCPACTGPLHFAGGSGQLECEYCGSKYEVSTIEEMYAEKNQEAVEAAAKAENQEASAAEGWDLSGLEADWGSDGAGMKAYSCPSCGAELICDAATAATSCPYCDNPTIVPGQFDGALKPDFIIPFKLDQKAAEAALKNFYKGKLFLPKAFADSNRIKEIKGVYVPFWLYDGEAEADVTYQATKVSVRRSGNEEITTTRHYHVRRAGSVAFEKIPVDASTKMPDEYMDSVEPFRYEELKSFSNAYLPGYLADKFDVSAEECSKRADERASRSALDAMRDSVTGYDSCIPVSESVNLKRGKVSYALMPVYMLNTKWKGENYLFAMNGQTGKLIGNLPVSWGKFWAWFAGIAVPIALIMAFLF